MTVVLHGLYKGRQNSFQSFATDSVCSFPQDRQRCDYRFVVDSPLGWLRGSLPLISIPQNSNSVLPVIPGHRRELVKNPLLLGPACASIPLAHRFGQFASGFHAEPSPHSSRSIHLKRVTFS